ncbi:MAG TPA: efflux RND transporter periplasmic adaptor subunit [Chthoniobacterales bacterium]|nr:efflux RND transporter periplasmic adaptor subunit [Chthoniobacterales bacterium]
MSVQTTNLKAKSVPPSPPKRSRFLRVLIWIVVLGLFGLGFYLVSMPKPAPKGRALGTVTITTATATKGNIGDYLDAIGTVTPVYTASIFSQVTGVVTKVNYQEGQIVKEGDPLVDIDDRQYQAQLVQAEGALQRDQNVLAQAQMDLQRYRDAWARNGVAKQTLDDQEKLVLQEQGTVKNDEGAVQFDQLQVEYCHIKAPIAGRVGLRPIDPGNLVTAGTSSSSSSATPLVVITQIQPITVVFTIAEDNLGAVMEQLRSGAKLTVDVFDRAAQKKLATGELIAVDNQIDTTTGTAKVRASFPNDDFALFPNQFVNTRLLVKTLQDVTLIPSSTIQQNGQTSFVYVIQDNVAHLKNIKPGVSDNGLTQVEGINPGDVLADSSFDKLQDNTKITVATGKPAATETPGGQQKHGNQHKQGNEKPASDQQQSASKGT